MGLECGQLLLGLFLLGFLVFCFFLLLFLVLVFSLLRFLLSLGISFCFFKTRELVFNGRVRVDKFPQPPLLLDDVQAHPDVYGES